MRCAWPCVASVGANRKIMYNAGSIVMTDSMARMRSFICLFLDGELEHEIRHGKVDNTKPGQNCEPSGDFRLIVVENLACGFDCGNHHRYSQRNLQNRKHDFFHARICRDGRKYCAHGGDS